MKLFIIILVLFFMTGCTLNVQMVNEFAGQRGDGQIVEDAKTAETTTPTVDIKADVPLE